jgi:hypothetical protein
MSGAARCRVRRVGLSVLGRHHDEEVIIRTFQDHSLG